MLTSAKAVTDPGVTPSASCIRSGDPNDSRAEPIIFGSALRSIAVLCSAEISQSRALGVLEEQVLGVGAGQPFDVRIVADVELGGVVGGDVFDADVGEEAHKPRAVDHDVAPLSS